MSLDYDLRAVADEAKTEEAWPITETLIWATMSVGIREITEANAEEFYTRLTAWRSTYGMAVMRITLADVRLRIGLKTNAFPGKSRATFRKQLIDSIVRDAEGMARQQAAALARDTVDASAVDDAIDRTDRTGTTQRIV